MIPAPGGEVQTRSSRPRPVTWCSATRTVPSGASSAAAARRAAFVEPISGTTSSERHRALSEVSAVASAGPSSGSREGAEEADGSVSGTLLRYGTRERGSSLPGTAAHLGARTRPASPSEE